MCLLNLLILLINGMLTLCISRQRDMWEQITVRYGFWHTLPQYDRLAFNEGYSRLNDVCKTDYFHGFLFTKDDDTQAMPIYDLNGDLAGIQTSIPGNMRGFDSRNISIDLPPVEIMPPVLKGHRDKNGILHYTVTAYFKHPSLLCSPLIPKGVRPGRGLFIQMGNNPEHHHLHIPLQSKHLTPLWKKGHCAPLMGTHYFMSLSPSLPCEKLYPLFLMYDMDGNLGAFGWVFQGRPSNVKDGLGWFTIAPKTYPFLFNTSMLPQCMFNDQFQVFGVHIYLRDKESLLCTRVENPDEDDKQVSVNSIGDTEGPGPVISINKVSSSAETNDAEDNVDIDTDKAKNSVSSGRSVQYSYFLIGLPLAMAYLNKRLR